MKLTKSASLGFGEDARFVNIGWDFVQLMRLGRAIYNRDAVRQRHRDKVDDRLRLRIVPRHQMHRPGDVVLMLQISTL
jgi:hypothetical protein